MQKLMALCRYYSVPRFLRIPRLCRIVIDLQHETCASPNIYQRIKQYTKKNNYQRNETFSSEI